MSFANGFEFIDKSFNRITVIFIRCIGLPMTRELHQQQPIVLAKLITIQVPLGIT